MVTINLVIVATQPFVLDYLPFVSFETPNSKNSNCYTLLFQSQSGR